MIPIKNLIRDGCWLKCMAVNHTGEMTFRMRILSFERLDYPQIDTPPHQRPTPIEEGAVRWLMKLEVVNLSKVSVLFGHLQEEMRVVDSDGFQFKEDAAGLWFTDFAKRTGLSLGDLLPKLKYQGAVIFKVPAEDTDYLLTIKDGTMEEI